MDNNRKYVINDIPSNNFTIPRYLQNASADPMVRKLSKEYPVESILEIIDHYCNLSIDRFAKICLPELDVHGEGRILYVHNGNKMNTLYGASRVGSRLRILMVFMSPNKISSLFPTPLEIRRYNIQTNVQFVAFAKVPFYSVTCIYIILILFILTG